MTTSRLAKYLVSTFVWGSTFAVPAWGSVGCLEAFCTPVTEELWLQDIRNDPIPTILKHLSKAPTPLKDRKVLNRLAKTYRPYLVPSTRGHRLVYHSKLTSKREIDEPLNPSTIWQIEAIEPFWTHLPALEKRYLVSTLSQILTHGLYDFHLNEKTVKPRELFPEIYLDRQLPVPHIGHNEIAETTIFIALYETAAISPRLFLKGAQRGHFTGVCRHSVPALAALLVEIGVSIDDLRVYSNEKYSHQTGERDAHVVLGVRIENEWLLWDPTADSRFDVITLGAQPSDPEYLEFRPLDGRFHLLPVSN